MLIRSLDIGRKGRYPRSAVKADQIEYVQCGAGPGGDSKHRISIRLLGGDIAIWDYTAYADMRRDFERLCEHKE